MESALESEWNFFSNVMYSNEESDFMAQLLNDSSVSTDFHGGSSFIWSDHEFQNTTMVDVDYKTDSLSNNAVNPYMSSNYDSYYYAADNCNEILGTNNDSISSDYCMKEASDLLDDDFLNRGMVVTDSIMQEAPLPKPEPSKEAELNHPVQKPKKRCYNARDTVQKNKRNVKSRKNQKLTSSCKISDEDTKSAICRQSSSSYGSDDDYEFNAANGRIPVPLADLDTKGGAPVDTNAKTRASRGSANDPQSLYARKRRERINGRLKTLQNLVPNGTKVDISTMLEEAVQYVKFLQLQIKLLSSDDLWMYAPIAYNGMDLGLNLNITMPMPRQ